MMYKEKIEQIWSNKIDVIECLDAINALYQEIDRGNIRVSDNKDGKWITNEWVKKAIIILFRIKKNNIISGAPENSFWFDKADLKFKNWEYSDFNNNKIRTSPGSLVRYPSYIGKNVVLMPSFINVGSYIGDGTMIDIGSSIGSCAQVGKNCHISGNSLLGGVLEPLCQNPVIVEDNCFIGANSSIVEGVIIEEGSVISMGVHIGASTKIINKESEEITYGLIPKYSVVIPGSYRINENISTYCVIIIKKVDFLTRKKTSINDLLREM